MKASQYEEALNKISRENQTLHDDNERIMAKNKELQKFLDDFQSESRNLAQENGDIQSKIG